MKPQTQSHRGRARSARRPLSARALVACVVGGLALAAFATATAAGWATLAQASFDGVSDGSGDGKSFATTVGTLTSSTSSGKSLRDAAPLSGVVRERLQLSDVGTAASGTIGVRLATSRPATGGVDASIVIEPLSDGGHFTISVTDNPNPDFCCPGSVGDGVTVEMFALDSDDGALSVAGSKLKTTFKKGVRYRVQVALTDAGDGGDYAELWLTNLSTNEVEYYTQSIVGGYRAAQAATVKKHAGKSGEWALDDFMILAPNQ